MARSPARAHCEIAELAAYCGWRHHHSGPSVTLDGFTDGYPSHTLVRGGRLLFVTFASRSGSLVVPERDWLEDLAAATSIETRVIRADDLRPLTRLLRGRGAYHRSTKDAPLTHEDVRPEAPSGRHQPSPDPAR
jgi:hypothetical protein